MSSTRLVKPPPSTSPTHICETLSFRLTSCALCADGNFLAVASHDNFVYIYAVTENGRKYSRVGKCTVSMSPHAAAGVFVSASRGQLSGV